MYICIYVIKFLPNPKMWHCCECQLINKGPVIQRNTRFAQGHLAVQW